MNGIPYPPLWYAASQAMLCFFGTILLFTLWQRGISFNGARRDPGLFYLSMAVLVWALIGVGLVLRVCPPDWPLNQCMAAVMASTMSNAFLLLAMAYFEYGPIEFKIAQDDWKWHFSVLLASIIVALWVLFVQSAWPDFLLSTTTLAILGASAYLTFKSHGFSATAIFSILVIVFVALTRYWESMATSCYPFTAESEWLWVLILTARAALILLFLAIGLSSRAGKAASVQTDEMALEFLGKNGSQNSWAIMLTMSPSFTNKRIEMSAVLHKILLCFAAERKRGDGWVKIKDKFYPADLSRISKRLGALMPHIFENDYNGSYRLRVTPNNIVINKQKFRAYPELMSLLGELE